MRRPLFGTVEYLDGSDINFILKVRVVNYGFSFVRLFERELVVPIGLASLACQ